MKLSMTLLCLLHQYRKESPKLACLPLGKQFQEVETHTSPLWLQQFPHSQAPHSAPIKDHSQLSPLEEELPLDMTADKQFHLSKVNP